MLKTAVLVGLMLCFGQMTWAQEVSETPIEHNIRHYAKRIGGPFGDFKVNRVGRRGDRIFVLFDDEDAVVRAIKSDKHWVHDIVVTRWSHHGAIKAWRYDEGPSLNIVLHREKIDGKSVFEIDIDDWPPTWKEVHHLMGHLWVEVIPDDFVNYILRRNRVRSQTRIARLLDKRDAKDQPRVAANTP